MPGEELGERQTAGTGSQYFRNPPSGMLSFRSRYRQAACSTVNVCARANRNPTERVAVLSVSPRACNDEARHGRYIRKKR